VVIKAPDEELAVVYRDPTQWSYVVRAPTGDIAGRGKAKTRRECEEWAIRLAEEYTDEEGWIIMDDTGTPPFDLVRNSKLLGEWRFVLWPAKGAPEKWTFTNRSPEGWEFELYARPAGVLLH
jgi:hypothetical protein